MPELAIVFLAGFLAALIDGALGMGFGPTSSSILLGSGLPPSAVATMVNVAKVVTGAASAAAHWRFGNVDHRLVRRLAGPGAVGAVIGATLLRTVDGAHLRPVLAAMLMVVAGRMLLRFSHPLTDRQRSPGGNARPSKDRRTTTVAVAGGVANGMVGAWGPVVTPFLLHRGIAPRLAVGSVNTAEVAVAVVASGSLLASMGSGGLQVGVVLAMLGGGAIAAPASAWVIRHVPARGLGVAVSGLLLLTNAHLLASAAGMERARWAAYAVIATACAAAAARPRLPTATASPR